ncbi:cyclin-T2-like [Sabethes cyaneus]|uniref:cyclin-T2-like n=1 Tax=Sabethes cyaneus TaxID=53552 RepID=UPI00237E6CB1|nr:cyclin-T2-like [Sabethes cyaneus]
MASGSASGSLAKDDSKWYFTSEQLANSPSRKCGMDADQELMYRQRAANLIQDMGQRLQVSQLCINTAIVYMHRFYAFHSFTHFHRNSIAAAALFLAAKVEEQPRKLEHIIKVVHICLGLEAPDPLKESYAEQAQDLVFNENVLLQTLGFDVAIDHPHTHVVKTCHLVKASKDLAQTSYFMASNSLHLTTMCLQYKPTVVACFCIHLACKWSRWEIPQSNEGRHWFHYVDKSVTPDLLKQLTDEFLHIFDRCPTRLKSKMKSIRADQAQSDDTSRRSASSSSGMPGSSSISRGIDDAGSSSSSHHRSSSHSQHSHSKQSSASGDPMLKTSQSSSSSNSKLSSSSSSNSRSRDRPSSSSSQQQQQQHNQPQTLTSSSGHYGSGAVIGKMQQPVQHHSSSRSGGPSQSSSSSSVRTSYMHEGIRDPKNRMMANVASSSSSIQMNPYNPNKLDRHSNQKNQSMPHGEGKSTNKSQNSMAASLFSNNSDMTSRMSSSSSMMKQPQAPYGSHPPSYSQSMSGRSNMPSGESTSVPNQQQQQQQQQYKNQLQQLSSSSESSFRLIDDSNRLTDPMQICTPPKQSKPSSIFSPDWKDTQVENNSSSVANTVSAGGSAGKARPQAHPPGLVKHIKESPSSREKKPVLPLFSDQQSQQHKQRSETPKKERRSDASMASSGNQQLKSAEKKTATSSSSLKRPIESTQSVNSIFTGNTTHTCDLLGINKLPTAGQAPTKRPLPNSEQIRNDDGTDFRESKVRKVEVPSPSDQLFASTFDLANTFDKQDDGFSLFSFNDPGSLLSQPLLSDSKPITSSKSSFSSTVNGIETNPALVSSLLKESLCSSESKFGTLTSSNTSNSSSSSTMAANASIVSSAPGSITGTSSSLLSVPSSGIAPSTSNMSTSSVVNQMLKVPDTIKSEPASIDMNAPTTISGTSFDPVSLLPSTTSTVSSGVSSMPSSAVSVGAITSDIQTLTGDILTAPSKDDEHHRSKSEKKKKKDKHKHKEKDKSKDKDREERKKHKKDKDRHRDREREKSNTTAEEPLTAPIKIKLPKDKLNLPSLSDNPEVSANRASTFAAAGSGIPASSDSGLKIKIPKDRLSGSSSLGATVTTGMGASSSSMGANYPATAAPNPLKLKISKDKIISTGSVDNSHNNGSGHGHNSGNSGTGLHHGHSGKKKDRERDREKTKSSKSSVATASVDYAKHNGNSSGSLAGSGGTSGNVANKSGSSKIIQQQQYSMYNANSQAAASQASMPHHPASFDYMQHAQAPTLQQQQQYFNQFGTFNVQQQQQTMINSSAIKTSGGNIAAVLPPYYYNSSNQNNGSNSSKK